MESPEDFAMLRCRKCRKGYVDSTCLYPIATDDGTAATCSIWHVNVERLPEWILTSVHQAHWTVGKLNCQSCGARLGAFNFINHIKCPCGQETTVHLSKSRVDRDHKRPLHVVRPWVARCGGGPGRPQADLAGTQTEHNRSEPREDLLVGSQFCCASISRRNPESQPITTHLDALWPLTDSRVVQPVPSSAPYTLSRRKCFLSNGRSRLELETSRSPIGLFQTSPVDLMEGESRCWRAESPRLSVVSNVTCVIPVSRERGSMQGEEHLQTRLQQHSSQQTPGGSAQLGEASGSPLSLRGTMLYHPSGEQQQEEEEEEVHEAWASPPELQAQPLNTTASPVPNRLCKREKNRLKSQRRKQRRRERWIHSQVEKEQSVSGSLTDSEEEDREGYTCAVCLDVYYSPYSCHPCGHVFCEPCLRTLAKNRPSNTPCPLCRTLITHTLFQKELNQTAQTIFPKVYHSRKQIFQKATCAKWPLPNCRKRFRIFWGYQRQAVPGRQWHFAPAGFTLDALDLTDMRGWLFDIDLVIIYIHSVNWILAFLILCFLAYFFFS